MIWVRSSRTTCARGLRPRVRRAQTYMDWFKGQEAVGLIRAFRSRSEQRRDTVMAKAEAMLTAGRPASEVVRFIGHTLTNKLIHEPTAALSEAAREGQQELLKAGCKLLDIKGDGS